MARGKRRGLELDVEDTVAAQIKDCDTQKVLRGEAFHHVLTELAGRVLRCMEEEKRSVLDKRDRAFITGRIGSIINARSEPSFRFQKFDHVMCLVGGERPWASGIVVMLNEDDPDDPTGQTKLPYVVQLDPPNGRLIAVPKDNNTVIRAEVCFGRSAGALFFTLLGLPLQPPVKPRRFESGARVACAVEDETGDSSVWSAGTVVDADFSVEKEAKELLPQGEWIDDAWGRVPYRVQLDIGPKVLVHRDEHWLVRDLTLQAEGARREEHDHQEVLDWEAGHGGCCGHDHAHEECCEHEHGHAEIVEHSHQEH